ncbi:PilZ domain-containing protein [Gallaecimonas mangrovi]|uniref:PilZ domain-containing protein n=1 Tax=Gallaecimonas mangrovi TaxID=2291597 RepID=UPI000E203216|nr:PilZ domain-containing protein [Gallaecimonas mangrovi]
MRAASLANNHSRFTAPRQEVATISNLNSTDALAMIEHGSELVLNVTTPVGARFSCKTAFIGTHSTHYLLVEAPKVRPDYFEHYFQEGFWVNIRAISPRGEGAELYFRSQLLHLLTDPLPVMALSIPHMMKVAQLRREARYDVKLAGKIVTDTHKNECELRDLSKSGCRFVTHPLGKGYQLDEPLSINLYRDDNQNQQFPALTGTVCNLQRSLHYSIYGLKFDPLGSANAASILEQLTFDGSKLALPE